MFTAVKLSEIGDFSSTLCAAFWCNTSPVIRRGVRKLSHAELNAFLKPFKKMGPSAEHLIKKELENTFGRHFPTLYEAFVERKTTSRSLGDKRMLVVALLSIREKIADAIEIELGVVGKKAEELENALKIANKK